MTRSITDLFTLPDRVAVVTGGAGPLGSVMSATLAELGASVFVADRPGSAPEEFAADLTTRFGGRHEGLEVDLTDPEAPARLVAAVAERFGRLDIVINNAAFTGGSGMPGYAVPFPEQTGEAFLMASRLNLLAPFLLVQAAAGLLRESSCASVVNISSIYGLVAPNMGLYDGTAMGNPAAYGATKAGLAHLTRYLSTVLAPDIRVNAIAPGGVAAGQPDDFVERYERLTPLQRMADGSDFRGVVAWLAGDASAYVTGQVIAVDGGWTAW